MEDRRRQTIAGRSDGVRLSFAISRRPSRRQARQRLRRRFQNKLAAPRKLLQAPSRAHAVSLLLLVMGIGVLGWFGTSDLFFIQNINVAGSDVVASEAVVHATGAQNFNVFFLQFGEIENRLRALPGVSDAAVSYEWPNTLHITLMERKAVFGWELNKKTSWVDDAGQIFQAPAPLTNPLVIRDNDQRARAQVAPPLVSGAKVIAALLPNVKRLEYSDAMGLSFTDEHGWRVILGQPEQLNAKLAMLRELSAYLVVQKIDAEYIDVRLPARAFYKPK